MESALFTALGNGKRNEEDIIVLLDLGRSI